MTPTTRSSPRTEKLDACPVCKSTENRHFFSAPDRLIGVPGEFTYEHCSHCDSVFQNPMVLREDLPLCYPPEYSAYDFEPESPELPLGVDLNHGLARRLRDRVRMAIIKSVWRQEMNRGEMLVGRVFSASRFMRERAFLGMVIDDCLPSSRGKSHALEIGCGAGWLLKRLAKVGWIAEGIEWDETAASRAAERSGCRVHSGDFRQLDLPHGKYELVVLNHVYEHLDDPADALVRFRELLKPGGRLVMMFPNWKSLDARWFGDRWFAWDPPRHLVLPSIKAIKDLGSRAGFRRVEAFTRVDTNNWRASKAYELGEDPERFVPQFDMKERTAIFGQQLLVAMGVDKGGETVVVLYKDA